MKKVTEYNKKKVSLFSLFKNRNFQKTYKEIDHQMKCVLEAKTPYFALKIV